MGCGDCPCLAGTLFICKSLVTVSLGIASLVPQAETSPKTLIDQADSALYQVKQHGRDGIWVYGANAMAARG
jgi:PleD family two-component response regulator